MASYYIYAVALVTQFLYSRGRNTEVRALRVTKAAFSSSRTWRFSNTFTVSEPGVLWSERVLWLWPNVYILKENHNLWFCESDFFLHEVLSLSLGYTDNLQSACQGQRKNLQIIGHHKFPRLPLHIPFSTVTFSIWWFWIASKMVCGSCIFWEMLMRTTRMPKFPVKIISIRS